MTTTTFDPAAALVALADTLPAARTAQYGSKIEAARQGTLSTAHAAMILRQLGGMSSPAEGEEARKLPSNPSGQSATSARSDDASDRQRDYAVDLLKTRVQPDERITGTVKTAAEVLALVAASGRMSRTMARNVIDSYKDRPRVRVAALVPPAAPQAPKAGPADIIPAPADVDQPVTEPGIYQLGDDVYKVQRSRQSGRLYAQKLVDGRFNYDQGWGALRVLRASHLMTTEQAAAFGQRFGMCVNGHPLSDRSSRYFGYGEKCAANNGWLYDPKLVPTDFE